MPIAIVWFASSSPVIASTARHSGFAMPAVRSTSGRRASATSDSGATANGCTAIAATLSTAGSTTTTRTPSASSAPAIAWPLRP